MMDIEQSQVMFSCQHRQYVVTPIANQMNNLRIRKHTQNRIQIEYVVRGFIQPALFPLAASIGLVHVANNLGDAIGTVLYAIACQRRRVETHAVQVRVDEFRADALHFKQHALDVGEFGEAAKFTGVALQWNDELRLAGGRGNIGVRAQHIL